MKKRGGRKIRMVLSHSPPPVGERMGKEGAKNVILFFLGGVDYIHTEVAVGKWCGVVLCQ